MMDEAPRRALALSAAEFLQLAIDPAMLDGVVANLALLKQHADRVIAFPLPPEIENAPVFAPAGKP